MVPVLLAMATSAILASAPAPAEDLTGALTGLLGTPYVDDAALDETGRWTFFAHPEKTAARPGLNCSGFVLAAARKVLGCRLTLAEATRDRLGDSGDGSPLGKDWDFGWDLVMNLSEGHARRAILPEGVREIAPAGQGEDGRSMRGFPVDDAKAWKKVLPQLRAGRAYLVSLSRVRRHLEHHHVALVLEDASGRTWFYQTLPRGRAHRLDIGSSEGMARLQAMFGPGIRILVIEVEVGAAAAAAPAEVSPTSTR